MVADLETKIKELKQQLVCAAKENEFNFQHPKVQRLSKELDHLIVRKMKQGNILLMAI